MEAELPKKYDKRHTVKAGPRIPKHVKLAIFQKYLTGRQTMAELAKESAISRYTIQTWINREHWAAKKKKFEAEVEAAYEAECLRLIAINKGKVMNRHLKVSEELENQVMSKLVQSKTTKGETKAEPRELQELGNALNRSSQVSARVVGIDRSANAAGGAVNITGSIVQLGMRPKRLINEEIIIDADEVVETAMQGKLDEP